MSDENNKMQVDIENLLKQNVNDLLSIKELYRRIEELGEKITQIKYIDNALVKKLKKEYEKLNKIILDENVQAKLSNDIETINSHLDTITKQTPSFFNVKTFLCDDGEYVQGNNSHDDTTGIQKAFDLAKQYRGTVYFPKGNYVITDSIRVGHYTTILGETSKGSVINNQTIKLDKPQLIDYTSDTQMEIVIQNMCFRGGTHGIYSSAGLQSISLDNVRFELQTEQAINSQKYLMVGSFKNVVFNRCNTALKVPNGVVNHNNFIDCQFLNLVDTGIEFNVAEVNNFIGCRFEAGGTVGKTFLWFRQSRNMNFEGCYFERIHKQLLLESNVKQGSIFKNCHFTYPSTLDDGLPEEFIFTSDGVVTFENNSWSVESDGSKNMVVNESSRKLGGLSSNTYLESSKDVFEGISSTILLEEGTTTKNDIPLLKIFGNTDTSSTTSLQTCTGEVLVNLFGFSQSGFPIHFSCKYNVAFSRIGSGKISCNIVPIYENKISDRGVSTLSILQRANPVATESFLDLSVNVGSELKMGFIKCKYNFMKCSSTRENYLDISMIS